MQRGEYSGVHVAVRGLLNAVVAAAAPEDDFTLYVQRRTPEGLPPESKRVRRVRPLWPAGWRAGRISWEQLRLHSRVFTDGAELLHCPAYVMPRLCLLPTVASVHDLLALTSPQACTAANRAHFGRMLPATLRLARRIVTPSEHVRRAVLDYAAGEGKEKLNAAELSARVEVIPWGVDARFRPATDAARREEVALRYGLPPRFALCVGRIEPKKNVQRAVEAYFAAAMARNLPHRLVLLGPRGWGVERETLKVLRQLCPDNRALRLGFVPDEDLPAIYSLADCLIFPSLEEGFGFPVLEAMACGTPAVCSDIPPLREIAAGAALLVDTRDLPRLREAVEAALTGAGAAKGLREKGLERAARYSWSNHAERTLALYRNVIAEDRRRRAR